MIVGHDGAMGDDKRKAYGKDDATKTRVVRVTDEIWEAAMARAKKEGIPLSDVIRKALIEYAGLPSNTPGVVGRADR